MTNDETCFRVFVIRASSFFGHWELVILWSLGIGHSPTGFPMRITPILLACFLAFPASAAELESRVLTHYIPQDVLETAVRTEGWTEIPLNVKGGVRKGDVVRIWAGGTIDRGNGDQPGQNVNGPTGLPAGVLLPSGKQMVLAPEPDRAFALLFKAERPDIHKCLPPGKPLEIKLAKDKEKLRVGFNDERGRYQDNHLGKGLRHELDPLWVRIEVVRVVVD
jgi:hypothetical protein